MLNIITFDGSNLEEYRKYSTRGFIRLECTEEIEKRFLGLFNEMLWKEDEGLWDRPRPRFDTDFDINIMKEIDRAHRCDLQVVKTNIGTAPLTCLSTGCKFGLLVNYYSQIGCKIVANWGSAGENVFELIGREMDIVIYMDKRKMMDYCISWDLKNVLIDGNDISEFDDHEMERNLCTVTSAKLKDAHEVMDRGRRKYIVDIPLYLQCDYLKLHKIFGNVCRKTVLDYVEDYTFLKELRYNIRTIEINVDTQHKYPTLWIFRKRGITYKFTLDTIYKYPNFWDMICEVEDIYQSDTLLDEIFMVVFDTQGYVLVDYNYPKHIAYSLVYNPHDKELNVIGVRETIEKLKNMAVQTEIEVTEKCPRKSSEGR